MLQITTQPLILGMQSSNARLEYTQPKGEWQMRTIKPKMEIRQGLPQVIIDQSQSFAEAGLKSLPMIMQEYADMGRQYVLEGIARRAQEGDMMARPPYGDAVAQISASRINLERADFNVQFIPQSRPEIDFTGLDFEINWDIGGSERTFYPKKPELQYIAGSLDVYVQQYNEVRFEYIDTRV